MVIKEFNEKDETNGNKIKKEKEQLIENVQMLANELDELNENNKNLHDKIMKDEKLKNIYELMKLKKKLKEENRLYKKIMVFRNRKNYIDLKETLQINSDSTIDLKELIFQLYQSNNISTELKQFVLRKLVDNAIKVERTFNNYFNINNMPNKK